MKFQQLVIFCIAILTQISCSQMIWKDTNLGAEISPGSEPSQLLVLEVHYQQKDSWNPLNGTTDKRNYSTQIDLVQFSNAGIEKIKSWKLPSWALAESAFYHSSEKTLYVLHGKNDEYGSLAQRLSVYSEGNPPFSYPAGPDNLMVFQASPSPNGKAIALVTAVSGTNWEFSEFELRILDPLTQKVTAHALSFWTALPLYGIRWSNDGNTLYVRTPVEVLALKNGKLEKAKSFPECFAPSTTYGKLAYKESFVQNKDPYQIKVGEKLPSSKMVTSIESIKICP